MAKRTKSGNLDMRFKSNRRTVAWQNFWDGVGDIFTDPLYSMPNPSPAHKVSATKKKKESRGFYRSIVHLYNKLGKKTFCWLFGIAMIALAIIIAPILFLIIEFVLV